MRGHVLLDRSMTQASPPKFPQHLEETLKPGQNGESVGFPSALAICSGALLLTTVSVAAAITEDN